MEGRGSLADIARENFRHDIMPPGQNIEDILVDGYDKVRSLVSDSWLKSRNNGAHEISRHDLEEPFVMTGGSWVRSASPTMHRFAKALLITEAYMEDRQDMVDMHEGALLIGEIAGLSEVIPVLEKKVQNVNSRLEDLSQGPSEEVNAVIHELLVAGRAAQFGRLVEMIPKQPSTSTPDLRLLDTSVPLVIECKRKDSISEYHKSEAQVMKELFLCIEETCRSNGTFGVFCTNFTEMPEDVNPQNFERACMEAVEEERKPVSANWGKVAYLSGPRRNTIEPTPLYSPYFLREAFHWSVDQPRFDGIVGRVENRSEYATDHVEEPLAVQWYTSVESAEDKRARGVSKLFSKACDQVSSSNDMGIVYLCLEDGNRPRLADQRIKYIVEQELHDWEHSARVPNVNISRLLPRALGHNEPDLVENVVETAWSVGDDFRNLIPKRVFTGDLR